MANFAERIKELMDETGQKPVSFAKKIGVQRVTVNRWKNGESLPSEENLYLLANFFNVSTYYLLGQTDDRNMITDESWEETEKGQEKADEERLLNRYRLLSPDMKKLVHAIVNNALVIDRDHEVYHM